MRPVYVDRARRTTELTTESPQAGGKHASQRDILVAKTPQGTFFGRTEIFLVAKTGREPTKRTQGGEYRKMVNGQAPY